jgi:hypothetical protein
LNMVKPTFAFFALDTSRYQHEALFVHIYLTYDVHKRPLYL